LQLPAWGRIVPEMSDDDFDPCWWRTYPLPAEHPRHWRIGALSLWVHASAGEWRIHHTTDRDDDEPLTLALDAVPVGASADVVRLASSQLRSSVQLSARCADRPVVVRPEVPFSLLTGERISLFVSAPIWVTLSSGDGEPVLDLPVIRPTDTWLGADTRSGTVGYALRTSSRTSPARLRHTPGRAYTRLDLVNGTDEPRAFERVVLPMPSLSLWHVGDQLWTDTVIYALDPDAEGEIRLEPPADGRPVSGPRVPRNGNVLRRAWATLFE
jgi:hypothetical protein